MTEAHIKGQQHFVTHTKPALTSHSSILKMTSTTTSRATFTVNKIVFTAFAADSIQENWANARTKVSITEGHCICWDKLQSKSLLFVWKQCYIY